ncbi:uncharacterized protein LOC135485879 isoform X2 [Lineus longissimus]|uniref:uncharacterized protein LOC135485879 isoform X2 n=1 Tax=Lineus longissimus TaxID=88925 RepID=UPI00315D31DF
MAHKRKLSNLEKNVHSQLVPIFGNLDEDTITLSLLDKSNNYEPLTEDTLLQRCLDDLLALRTFTKSTMENNNNKEKDAATSYTCSTRSPATEIGLLDSDFDSPDVVILNEKISKLKPIVLGDSPATTLTLSSEDSFFSADPQSEASTSKATENANDLSFSLERGGVYKVKTKLKYSSPSAQIQSDFPFAQRSPNDKSGKKGGKTVPQYFEISDTEMLELADLVESPKLVDTSVRSSVQSDERHTQGIFSSFGESSNLTESTPNVSTPTKSSAENLTKSVIGSISKSTAEESAKFSLTPPRLNLGKKDNQFTLPKSVHRVATATVTSSEIPAKFSSSKLFFDEQASSIDKKSKLPRAATGSGLCQPTGGFKFKELDRSNGLNMFESKESSPQKDIPVPYPRSEQPGSSAAAGSRLSPPAKSGFSFGSFNSPSIYATQDSSSKNTSTSATSPSSPIKPGHFRSASAGWASSISSQNGAPKLDRSHSLLESPETKEFSKWLKEHNERTELWFEHLTPQKDKPFGTPVTGRKGETPLSSGLKNVSTPIPGHDGFATPIAVATPIPGHSSANSREHLSDKSASELDMSDIDELPELGQSHDASPPSSMKHRHLSGKSCSSVSYSDSSANSSTDQINFSADMTSDDIDDDNLPVLDVVKRCRDKFKVPVSAGSQPPNLVNRTNNSSRGAAGNTELYSMTIVNRQKDYEAMRDLYHKYKKLKKSKRKLHIAGDANCAIQLLKVAKRKYEKSRENFLLKYDEKVELGMNKANAALHSAKKRESLVTKMKKNSDVGKAVQTGAKSSVVQQVSANIASAKIAGPKVTTAAYQGPGGVASTAAQQPGQNTLVNTSQSNRVEKAMKSAAVGKNSDTGKTVSGSGNPLASGSGSSIKIEVESNTRSDPVPPYRPFSFGRDARTNVASNTQQNNTVIGGIAGPGTTAKTQENNTASGGNTGPGNTGFQFGGNAIRPRISGFQFGGNATGTNDPRVEGPGTAGFGFGGQAAPGAAAKVQERNTGAGRNAVTSAAFGIGQSVPKQNIAGVAFGQGAGNNTATGFTIGGAPKPNNTGFAFGQGTGNDAAMNAAYAYGVAMNATFGSGRTETFAMNAAFGNDTGVAANLLGHGAKPKPQARKSETLVNAMPPNVGGDNAYPTAPTAAKTDKPVEADGADPKPKDGESVPFVGDAGNVNAKLPNVGGANPNPPTPTAAKTDKPVGAGAVGAHPRHDPPPARMPDILGHPVHEVMNDEQIAQNFNEKTAKGLLEIFPKADRNFILRKLEEGNNEDAIATILLEMPPEARAKGVKPAAAASGSKTEKLPDYLNSADLSVRPAYGYSAAFDALKNQYLRVPVQDLHKIVNFYGQHYSHAKKCLDDNLQAADVLEEAKKQKKFSSPQEKTLSPIKMRLKKANGPSAEWTVRLLKNGRQMRPSAAVGVHPELQKEIQYMKNQEKKESEEKDEKLANEINEKEYEETDQLIECGCCYCEVAFERMIQCYEGHLFCRDCLQRYAQEAVFGQGKMSLSCMTDGCSASFPRSQLESTLSDKILHQYDDRCQEEAINLAGIDNLVGCPFCDFKAVLDVEDKVFVCPNEKCGKSSCRHCGLDWEEHFGKRCDELEKKDETKLRTTFEEKMTQAKIRTCQACKASFMKSDGCNKMTCRCSATMCYICRKANIDYNHFCRHPRSPKKECKTCSVCSLWSNPEEDDERALQEVKKESIKARKDLGFDDEKLIGAPDEPAAKKVKYGPTAVAAAQGQAPARNQNQPQPPRPGNPGPLGERLADAFAQVEERLAHGAQPFGRRRRRQMAKAQERFQQAVARGHQDMRVDRAPRIPVVGMRQWPGHNNPPPLPPQPPHGWPMNYPQPPQGYVNAQRVQNMDYFQNDDLPHYNYHDY